MGTKKKFLIIIAIIMLCVIIKPNKSEAALQSNGGTPATKNLDDWMLQIRQMQELGGTLGRKDVIDTTNLTSGATDLDIHMEKNTEYGAMVILSASSYGNPNKIGNGETTTGNSTGVVMNLNHERVSVGTSQIASKIFKNATQRYKNIYEQEYKEKNGDALGETFGWHGSSTSNWVVDPSESGMIRAYNDSVFYYYRGGKSSSGATWGFDAKYSVPWASRAAIVVGTGI